MIGPSFPGITGVGSSPQQARAKVWEEDCFASEFCDHFAGDVCDGGDVLHTWLYFGQALEFIIQQATDGSISGEVGSKALPTVRRLRRFIDKMDLLLRKLQVYLRWNLSFHLTKIIDEICKCIGGMNVGDVSLIPLPMPSINAVMVVEICPTDSSICEVTIVNPSPYAQYHPKSVDPENPSKIKQQIATTLAAIPRARLMSEAVWAAIFLGARKLDKDDVLYTHLFSWMTGTPFEAGVTQNLVNATYATPAKSLVACFWKSLVHSLKFLLRKAGLSDNEVKIIRTFVKFSLLEKCLEDLASTLSIKVSTQKLIQSAAQNTAMSLARNYGMMSFEQLKLLKHRVEDLDSKVMAKLCDDGNDTVAPPKLDITNGWDSAKQPDSFPLLECHRRVENVDHFAGAKVEQAKSSPLNFLKVPGRVTTLHEAMTALGDVRTLMVRIAGQSAQSGVLKNAEHLATSVITNLLLEVLPTPVGPNSRAAGRHCTWHPPAIQYCQQLSILVDLHAMTEFFTYAQKSIKDSEEFDGTRMTVLAAIACIGDAVVRQHACDCPSPISLHYGGVDGRSPFMFTLGPFVKQSAGVTYTTPHALTVRAQVLDYFDEVREKVPNTNVLWKWDDHLRGCPGSERFLRQLCQSESVPFKTEQLLHFMCQKEGDIKSIFLRYYPELYYLRNIVIFFKYYMGQANTYQTQWFSQVPNPPQMSWDEQSTLYVYGFNGHHLDMKAAVRHKSRSVASTYTSPFEVLAEDDLLHIKSIPAGEGDILGQRDAELLFSFLTVPYMRIPLVLRFFATEDRVSCLRDAAMKQLIVGVLFEPGRFLPQSLSGVIPEEVPAENADVIATPCGYLINELLCSPEGVIEPLLKLMLLAKEMDAGTVFNETAREVILFLIRVVARVNSYIYFTLEKFAGTHNYRDVNIVPANRALLEKGAVSIQSLIDTDILPMLEAWTDEVMKSIVSMESSITVDTATSLASKLHAVIILLLAPLPPTEEVSSRFLSSFTFLTTRYSWGTHAVGCEYELYLSNHRKRRSISAFLSTTTPAVLSSVMDSVVRVATSTGLRSAKSLFTWGLVAGPDCVARFARLDDELLKREGRTNAQPLLLKALQKFLQVAPSEEFETVKDGMQDVEVNLQTMTLTFKAAHLQALPSEVASQDDVIAVFSDLFGGNENLLSTMQCAVVEDSTHRLWVRLVGQDHDVKYWKTSDTRFAIPDDMMRYFPDDMTPLEQSWIYPLFEPVRRTYFERPFWMAPIFILLPQQPLHADNGVAILTAVCSRTGQRLKEIVCLRHFRCVHVYDIFSHARRFHRSLVYTSDVRYTLREMKPSIAARINPWPSWERHGAGDADPDESVARSSSSSILRHCTHPDNVSKSIETFVPKFLLSGLIPDALLEAHDFWQDADDNIRGYPKKPKKEKSIDVPQTPQHLLWIHWRETHFDTIGTKNTCVQVFRFAVANAAPRASEQAVLKSKQLKMADVVEDEIEMTRLATDELDNSEAGAFRQSSMMYTPKPEASTIEDHNLLLLDLLYANEGSPLFSLANVLTRIELLSHILVWTTKTDYDPTAGSPVTLDLIQLPRLKLSFAAKLAPDGKEYLLYSLDHSHLFVSNVRQPLVIALLQGVPHSLVLSDVNESFSLLVPSLNVVRPQIDSAPFSTELVLFRSDRKWYNILDTRYYLYPVHVSLSFLFTPTLASALYLLYLRLLHRDYDDAFQLASTIGTDMELTKEEDQIFDKFSYVLDSNPNAHACRAKISLMVADSPVKLGWYTPSEVCDMLGKLSHVTVSCLLPFSEERRLLYVCRILELKMGVIRDILKAEKFKETFAVISSSFDKPKLEKDASPMTAQQRVSTRVLYSTISNQMREKLNVRVNREDAGKLLEIYFNFCLGQLDPYHVALLANRCSVVEAESRAMESKAATEKCTLVVPPLGKDLNWLSYTDYQPQTAKPVVPTQKNEEARTVNLSTEWDYWYCGSTVRTAGLCRCKSCNEKCGGAEQKGCPCPSCEKFNKAHLSSLRLLPQTLTFSKSMRTVSFYDSFAWIGDVMAKYNEVKLNETYPYLTKGVTLRDPNNSFLRYYELLTSTTKVKIATQDSGRDIAQIMFHFAMEARNPASGIGHFMHFILKNPQVWGKLTKYNRNSKVKMEARLSAIYNSIFEMASHVKTQPPPPPPSKLIYVTSKVISLRPRSHERTNEIPLQRTMILPIPNNTDCNKRILKCVNVKQLELLSGEGEMLTTPQALLDDLATFPLRSVIPDGFIQYVTRESVGQEPIQGALPFDLSTHQHAAKSVAKDMLSRIESDMQAFADKSNKAQVPKMDPLLSDAILKKMVNDRNTVSLRKLVEKLKIFYSSLQKLREGDLQYVAYAFPVLARTANHVGTGKENLSSTLLLLRRFAKREADVTTEYLVASLCSSTASKEWRQINPFLKEETCDSLLSLVSIAVLRANRVGHINRVCEGVQELQTLLSKIIAVVDDHNDNRGYIDAVCSAACQKADNVASQLVAARVYIDKETNAFDPRFLIFEFTWNLVLRKRQRELILEMFHSVSTGKSAIVKQMIMGAGKTTVVGPLLGLMLANGSNLIVQVVPPALLDFTRTVLRSTFSSVLRKQIFTFVCDRSDEVDSELLSKFVHATQSRGIVVTTPSSVKSIFLKFIEGLDRIVDTGRKRNVEMENEAKDILKVLSMWRNSILIMDEVDMLLHPLKSELNFPIGNKHDIDFTPARWKLPIHLMDPIFYFHTKRITVNMKDSPDAHSILRRFREVVKEGLRKNALQEMPHLTLLNLEFYETSMKPVLAEWLLLFFKAQHLIGLSDTEVLEYTMKRPTRASNPRFIAKVESLDPLNIKMLNLGYEWLSCFMPHVMQKIDRVSFGVMNADDMRRAKDEHPNMPRSRFVTAIPFIGKDLPSQSSEFAHPDVVIGLTILAFRYEGLRETDYTEIMREIHATVEKEVGRFTQRKTNIMFTKWVQASGGKLLQSYNYGGSTEVKKSKREKLEDEEVGMQPTESMVLTGEDEGDSVQKQPAMKEEESIQVLPLKLMKQANQEETKKLYKLFRRTAEVIHWYLCESVFPEFMRHQNSKLSASGQELGGDVVFQRRIGFSGTPSDLLPAEMGRCGYEVGTDGQLIHTLTSPSVMTHHLVTPGWSVRSLLDYISTASPPFHALIDTGALITGLSNLQVAQYLLKRGLHCMEGVVFLDEHDRKMILVRATGRVLKLAECGIPKVKRFAFYDQVHTTGMDIEHTPNAQAVCTLGKDMTFRDFSQGAYRMRGIGQGQTVEIMIIPEVYDLITRSLHGIRKSSPKARSHCVLVDVSAWLLVNSIRSEHTQHNQLCLQSCANVWRKEAFSILSNCVDEFKVSGQPSETAMAALELFREAVNFTVAVEVPQPQMFSEAVSTFVAQHERFVTTDLGKSVINGIVEQSKREDEIDIPVIDVQMVQEQEEEKEAEQEEEKQQEIEIEKYVDVAYSRDEESATPWKLSSIRTTQRAVQFYKLLDFHLYKRRTMEFPHSLMLSRNYFNPKWTGHRRMKNMIVTMEWVPSQASLKRRSSPSADYNTVPVEWAKSRFSNTLQMFVEHQGGLTSELLQELFIVALNLTGSQLVKWEGVFSGIEGGTCTPENVEQLFEILCGNQLREEEDGRFTVALSLAEAETIRRVIHLRNVKGQNMFDDASTSVALRLIPSLNVVLDQTVNFVHSPTTFQPFRDFQCFRYFDCDLHFSDPEFGTLLRSLHNNPVKHRQAFFQQVIACRRRARQRWDKAPVALLFLLDTAFTLLHQRSVGLCILRELQKIELNLGDAFLSFNNSHSGVLAPSEVWGASRFCRLNLSAEDVLDFIDVADAHKEGTVQYPDFLCVLTGSRELEETDTSDDKAKNLPVISPFGSEELHALKQLRVAKQRQEETDASKEMETENQRVMDEIEAEQIREELELLQAAGNPKLGDTSLTFTFDDATSLPKLLATVKGKCCRVLDEVKECLMLTNSSAVKTSLRPIKHLRKGEDIICQYSITFEIRIPKVSLVNNAEKSRGLISVAQTVGQSVSLAKWPLPMFVMQLSSPLEFLPFEVAICEKDKTDKETTLNEQQQNNECESEEQSAQENEEKAMVHIFKDAVATVSNVVGCIPYNALVKLSVESVSTSLDGTSSEWRRVKDEKFPAGWVVTQFGTVKVFQRQCVDIELGSEGTLKIKIENFDEKVDSGQGQVLLHGALDLGSLDAKEEESDDDDMDIDFIGDVGDLLEAIKKAKQLKPGDQVARNNDNWDRGNEDGGPGKVGKVLKVEEYDVTVQWASGVKANYNFGQGGKFELIKVADGDEEDEGEIRETMNDDRWVKKLKSKSEISCVNCKTERLAVDNWFRCNQCEDYNLCKKCFRSGLHNEHDFTDMKALSTLAESELGVGSWVKVKIAIETPSRGWQGASHDSVGLVADIDYDTGTLVVDFETTEDDDWVGLIEEVEQTEAPTEEAHTAAACVTRRVPTLDFIASNKWCRGVALLSEVARRQFKFVIGDRVKALRQSYDAQCLATVRGVFPEKQTCMVLFEDCQDTEEITWSNMSLCSLKIGDKVRFKASCENPMYGWGPLKKGDRKTEGKVTYIGNGGQDFLYLNVEVGGNNLSAADKETEIVSQGMDSGIKWFYIMNDEQGNFKDLLILPSSASIAIERAFSDGNKSHKFHIKEKSFVADFSTMSVAADKHGPSVAVLERQPPKLWEHHRPRPLFDDSLWHLVTLAVGEDDVLAFCDGEPAAVEFGGNVATAIQRIRERTGSLVAPRPAPQPIHSATSDGSDEEMEEVADFVVDTDNRTVSSFFPLLSSVPFYVLDSSMTPEDVRTSFSCVTEILFPRRFVSFFTIDWAEPLKEVIIAQHKAILLATSWTCRSCQTKNVRVFEECEECQEPRTERKADKVVGQGKVKAVHAKSREATSIRQKLQGKLRSLFQKQLDSFETGNAVEPRNRGTVFEEVI